MRSKKCYYLLIVVVVLLYVVEWFINSVYLRILAGSIIIVAVNLYPVPSAKKDNKRENSELLNEKVADSSPASSTTETRNVNRTGRKSKTGEIVRKQRR